MSVSPPLTAWIEGIGLRGPGLDTWPSSIDVLTGTAPYLRAPTALVAPSSLPPAERRRVGKGVKIALEVGFAATAQAGRDTATLPSVFASSSGDGDNCDAICRELAGERMISPTRFHNSVHNAPSGYWGIASRSMASSTSLCAFDDSFIAGLDEALAQLHADADAVVLIAYDAPYPEPLNTARPTPDCFGVGLVLARAQGPNALARITLSALPASSSATATRHDDAALEACRTAIPAARSLPLLAAIASRDEATIVIDGVNGMRWALHVQPLSAFATIPSRQSACA